MAARAWGEETPSEPKSSRDDNEEEDEDEEEERNNSLSPLSALEDLPSLGDLFSQQAGISVGARQTKRPRMGAGRSSGPPPQSRLMLVYSDL
jgi:hypothetical protein